MRSCLPLLALTAAVFGCGPAATIEEVEVGPPGVDVGWQDHPGGQIPPPVSRGWPIRGGDPESDEQRAACVSEIDESRVHIGRAIDSAKAIGNHDRVKCLAQKAAFLKTIRTRIVAPSVTEEGEIDLETGCVAAQGLVDDARACP